MRKIKPLLEEEKETFYFMKDSKTNKKEKYINKENITTAVIGVFVLWLMWFSFYPFYVGFVNYDSAHGNKSVDEQKKEEIPLNSVIVNETYGYIDATSNNALKDALKDIYSGNEVMSDTMSSDLKFAIVFKYLGVTCDNGTNIFSLDKITEAANKIFNDTSFAQNISDLNGKNIYGFNITFDNEGYGISLASCDNTNDFVYKKINKVITSEDILYIYEVFGYFVNTNNNNYIIYSSALKNNSLTTYSGNINEFTNDKILKTYKWTYKKGDDGNYYFISVMAQ